MKAMIATLLSLVLCPLSGQAQQDDELLAAEQAFGFSAAVVNVDTIETVWTIAEGYYMYRSKFGFAAEPDQALLGTPDYPTGTVKHDDYFGDVETYTRSVRITLPLQPENPGANRFTLIATGQGCNEPVGVCYPPITHRVTLTIPTTASAVISSQITAAAETTPSSGSVTQLQKLLGLAPEPPEFLDPDDAFRLELQTAGDNALVARFEIAPGYYLYRDKISFEAEKGDAQIGVFDLPPGYVTQDAYFGEVEIYPDGPSIILPLERNSLSAGSLTVNSSYQGCAEKGICYPPIRKTHTLTLPSVIQTAAAAQTSVGSSPTRTLIAYLAAAFAAGFLLTFTPCVLPLIPIMSSIIVGQGGATSRLRGGAISIAYVLGTTATYAAIGAVAGTTGDQLQAYFQNIWAVGSISIILVLMALSMFGLYDIQIPASVQSRLSARTSSLGGGSFGVIFLLGAISALVVGACVSPLLISVLSIAILQGDPYLGAGLMFSMALGMGVVLVAIGFGAGFLLPRAGAWMDRVKCVFGVLLLAVAIYLLGTIPAVPVLLLWAALLIITGVYLGATQAIPGGATGWRYLWKGVGTVCVIWGVLAMIGGFSGQRDILRPITPALFRDTAVQTAVPGKQNAQFYRVNSDSDLDRQLATAMSAGQPVIIDFYADWCTDCIRMVKTTFRDPDVLTQLARFSLLKVDVTDPADPVGKAIKQRFDVFGPPALVFIDADGHELTERRLYGYLKPSGFLALLTSL